MLMLVRVLTAATGLVLPTLSVLNGVTAAQAQTQEHVATAEVVGIIGLIEGPAEYLFGRISSIAIDPNGRVYVADVSTSTIRIFTPDGEYLNSFGGPGEGPGEYTGNMQLVFGGSARLFIRDNRRVTVLQQDANSGLWTRLEETRSHGWPLSLQRARSRVDSLGRYFDPRSGGASMDGRTPPDYFYVQGGMDRTDTLRVPDYRFLIRTVPPFYLTGDGGGKALPGLAHAPFEPVPSWDITDRGTIIGGLGDRYLLYETTMSGDTIRVLRGNATRGPVPDLEARDSARALAARLDSVPVPLGDVIGLSASVARGALPDSLPAFVGVHVASDGYVWVERWPLRAGRPLFDILDNAGTHRRSIEFPRAFSEPFGRMVPPVFTSALAAGVIQDPQTEIQQVIVLRY